MEFDEVSAALEKVGFETLGGRRGRENAWLFRNAQNLYLCIGYELGGPTLMDFGRLFRDPKRPFDFGSWSSGFLLSCPYHVYLDSIGEDWREHFPATECGYPDYSGALISFLRSTLPEACHSFSLEGIAKLEESTGRLGLVQMYDWFVHHDGYVSSDA